MMAEDVAAQPVSMNLRHSAMMRASFAVEAPLSDSPLPSLGETDAPLYYRVLDDFASAWTLAASGDLADAREVHARMQRRIGDARVLSVEEGLHEDESATSADDHLVSRIIAGEVEALLAFHQGDVDRALELLGRSVEEETGRPPYYGPPHIPKPADELMGEMLLALDRPSEAAAMFEQSLGRHTNRTLSLLGLSRAQEMAGDERAAETWSRLHEQWRGAPHGFHDIRYTWLPAVAASAAR